MIPSPRYSTAPNLVQGYAEFDELSHASFNVNARYRSPCRQDAPIYTLGIKLGGRDLIPRCVTARMPRYQPFEQMVDQSTEYDTGTGLPVVVSRFDTEQVRLFGNLDELFQNGLFYVTYAYATGDIVSSASPTLEIINAAEEIEPMTHLAVLHSTSLLSLKPIRVITLGYNELLDRGTSFDMSLRFVDSDASGDIVTREPC